MRGSTEVLLPFVAMVGMQIQDKGMVPIRLKKGTWAIDENCFFCTGECEGQFDFSLADDINELSELLDPLRDAQEYGWLGLDKIYRDM